jgi:C_GCAxxG_C_C family probable redox protein
MESFRARRALQELEAGFNCAQAVLLAFAEESGLSRLDALRVAGAFGGGMGRSGTGPCGALSGALMALGLRFAKTEAEDDAARDRCYAEGRAFLEAFQARCGGLSCRDLLGHDVSTSEGYQAARDTGAFQSRCPALLRAAVDLVEEATR